MLLAGAAVTGAALWGYSRMAGGGHPAGEVVAATVANLFVTIIRFAAMRLWGVSPVV